MKKKLRILRSLTASQSPTGKPLSPGDDIEVSATIADDLIRRQAAEPFKPETSSGAKS